MYTLDEARLGLREIHLTLSAKCWITGKIHYDEMILNATIFSDL